MAPVVAPAATSAIQIIGAAMAAVDLSNKAAADAANWALCEAAQGGNTSQVKGLLNAGVSANARDRSGFCALHRCCVGGSIDVASLLLARGANVNASDQVRAAFGPALCALRCSCQPDIRRSLRAPRPSSRAVDSYSPHTSQYGDLALHYACQSGNTALVRILLAAGGNSLGISADGRTPLSVAVEEAHHAIVELLLDHLDKGGAPKGGDVEAARKRLAAAGSTGGLGAYQRAAAALGDASYTGDVRAVHSLLMGGADVNGADADGFSSLHRASSAGNVGIMELLLAHGADPNARDGVGCAPLHYAAFCGHTDAAYILISAGADPSRRNKDGLTASDVAAAEGRDRVGRLLSKTWTKAENLDFAHGVVLEGELKAKRSNDALGALFRWKSKYAVLSRHYRALFLWSGNAGTVEGAVMRLALTNIESVVHDAKGVSARARPLSRTVSANSPPLPLPLSPAGEQEVHDQARQG
jgi:ankyrin repeat protein